MRERLERITQWWNDYYDELTWFIVGMLFNNMLTHLALGQFGMAVLDIAIAGTNIYFWKTRDV